jgi:hypothetical protein
MSRYELEFASGLAVSALASAGTFYYAQKNRQGKIKLGDDEGPDPFDITEPVDFVDGYPIDEAAFWIKVRSSSQRPHSSHILNLNLDEIS